jgi:plastocyanin domain-containing protein
MKSAISRLASIAVTVTATVGCIKSAPTGEQARGSEPPGSAQKATVSTGVTPITVNEDGFVPNHIEVRRGQQTTLRFTRTSEKTCATEVAFPELNLKQSLPLNQPVDIEVPSDQARTLTFQCGMGMYKSKVVIF